MTCKQVGRWGGRFVHWYNVDDRHSGIGYVTPSQRRRAGEDREVSAVRHALYLIARVGDPTLGSGATRDCTSRAAVALNPERDAVIDGAIVRQDQRAAIVRFG